MCERGGVDVIPQIDVPSPARSIQNPAAQKDRSQGSLAGGAEPRGPVACFPSAVVRCPSSGQLKKCQPHTAHQSESLVKAPPPPPWAVTERSVRSSLCQLSSHLQFKLRVHFWQRYFCCRRRGPPPPPPPSSGPWTRPSSPSSSGNCSATIRPANRDGTWPRLQPPSEMCGDVASRSCGSCGRSGTRRTTNSAPL